MGEQSRLLEGARMLSFLVALALVAVASGNACKGKPTGLSLITDAPELVSQTANGKLYAVKTIEPNLLVAHVYGTGKARGLAYGTLLKPYLKEVADAFFGWVEGDIENAVKKYVPKDIADLVAIYGLDAVLDVQYLLMKSHMSAEFLAEVEGVAEASGLSYAEIMRLTVFPDLVKAHCSMVGAWGSATDATYSDSLVQRWPLVTVFHSNSSSAFATLGWPLFLGAL